MSPTMHRQNDAVKSLSERRTAIGLRREDLASQTGLTLRTIERIESGAIRRPQPLTRKAIAEVLNCDPAELWPEEAAA